MAVDNELTFSVCIIISFFSNFSISFSYVSFVYVCTAPSFILCHPFQHLLTLERTLLIGSPKIFSMTSFSLSLRSICAVGVLLLALRSSVDDSELVCELERALKLLLEG